MRPFPVRQRYGKVAASTNPTSLTHSPMSSTNSSSTPVWFITGASSGFGLSLAQHALRRGYRVVATARQTSKLAELAASAPDRVLLHALDVTVAGQADAAVAAATARF